MLGSSGKSIKLVSNKNFTFRIPAPRLKKKRRTVELTRRRKSKHPPPHQVSCERRSRRSRPTLYRLCAAPGFRASTKKLRIEPCIVRIKSVALLKIFPPQTLSHLLVDLMRNMRFVFNNPLNKRRPNIPMRQRKDMRARLELTNEDDASPIRIIIENRRL